MNLPKNFAGIRIKKTYSSNFDPTIALMCPDCNYIHGIGVKSNSKIWCRVYYEELEMLKKIADKNKSELLKTDKTKSETNNNVPEKNIEQKLEVLFNLQNED